GSLRDSASLPSARLMRLLRPLPRLRGRDREGARNKIRAGHPPPNPPPQAGEGADRDRGDERRVGASPPLIPAPPFLGGNSSGNPGAVVRGSRSPPSPGPTAGII